MEKKKQELKKLKNPKAFVDYSQTIDDVYENLEGYNPTKKRWNLTVFSDMIIDMKSNKKFSPIVTESFLGGKNSILYLFLYSNCVLKCLKP